MHEVWNFKNMLWTKKMTFCITSTPVLFLISHSSLALPEWPLLKAYCMHCKSAAQSRALVRLTPKTKKESGCHLLLLPKCMQISTAVNYGAIIIFICQQRKLSSGEIEWLVQGHVAHVMQSWREIPKDLASKSEFHPAGPALCTEEASRQGESSFI